MKFKTKTKIFTEGETLGKFFHRSGLPEVRRQLLDDVKYDRISISIPSSDEPQETQTPQASIFRT